MGKPVRFVCLTFLLTFTLLMVSGPSCEAASNFIKVQIKLDKNANPPAVYVKELGNRFVGVCKAAYKADSKKCQGNEYEWQLVVQGGSLAEGEEVMIKNAPEHPACFAGRPLPTWNSVNQNTKFQSGLPEEACARDKYGTYWPYVIEFWKNGELVTDTDPGGIIFP